jgi:uncharacterized protein YecE (DUF72 family)
VIRAGVLVGTCSWTDKTLVESGSFYPPSVRTAADRLRFYADSFPIVEVDATFYAPPSEQNARLWVERTPAGFIFDIKAFSLLTTHSTQARMLPAPLPSLLPADVRDKPRLYLRDLPSDLQDAVWEVHRRALALLSERDKLGVVLFQFPHWFRKNRQNVAYLETVARELAGFRIAVEFRGGGWMDPGHERSSLDILERLGLSYVCVDEPQGFASSTPPVVAATSEIAVVRFHGRAAELWEKKTASAAERFRYLYTEDELREWVPRVRKLAEQASEVHALMNNCYRDYGIVNARQLAALLDDE